MSTHPDERTRPTDPSPGPLLPRYLRRLGSTMDAAEARSRAAGGAASTLALLDELLAAHVEAICFENLDVLAGRGIALEPAAVAAALVDGGRGGYCHQHAALVRSVLDELGIASRPVLARVLLRPGDEPGPLSHRASLAEVGDELVLVDPGFGAGTPTVCLTLGDERPRESPQGQFRLVAPAGLADASLPDDLDQVLQARPTPDEEWRSLYGLVLHRWRQADLAVANWYTSTQPDTLFVRHLVAARSRRDGSRQTLKDRQLHELGPDGERRRELASAGELAEVLRELFSLAVEPSLVEQAWAATAS